MVNASGTLFFLSWASDGGPGRYELWKSDGTAAGTVVVKKSCSNENGFVFGLVSLNDRVIFTFHDDVHGYELWQE
jgi:ELWxxDGT repeat protein